MSLRTKNNVIIEPGQRVAVEFDKDSYYLGIVWKLHPLTIRYDDGTESDATPEELQAVEAWKANKKDLSAAQVKKMLTTAPVLTMFKSKEHLDWSVVTMLSMWRYVNHVVFKNKLREPKLKRDDSAGSLGLCHGNAVGKQNKIVASAKLRSPFQLFETIAHEMVHQWNFQIERENDHHGDLFMKWAPALLSKLGIVLTLMGSYDDMPGKVKDKKKEKPYWVIVGDGPPLSDATGESRGRRILLATYEINEDKAEERFAELRAYYKRRKVDMKLGLYLATDAVFIKYIPRKDFTLLQQNLVNNLKGDVRHLRGIDVLKVKS